MHIHYFHYSKVFTSSFLCSTHLEKSLQMLMDRVDDMSQDTVKNNSYSRSLSERQQQKHQVIHQTATPVFSSRDFPTRFLNNTSNHPAC